MKTMFGMTMKRAIPIFSLTALLCAALWSLPLSAQGPGGGMGGYGQGMGKSMGGPRMGSTDPVHMGQAARQVGIAVAKIEKIEELIYKFELKIIDLKSAKRKADLQFSYELKAETIDKAKVAGLIKKIGQNRTQINQAALQLLVDIRSILTAEEYQKISDLRRQQFKKARRGKRSRR